MVNNDYIIEIPFLRYDKKALYDYMISHGQWTNEGYVNDYFRPNELLDIFSNIYNQVPEFELSLGRTRFAELKPGAYIAPHTDVKRKAGINIPLDGDFDKTPILFHDKNRNIVFEHYYKDTATIINAEILHSVRNRTRKTRFMFSLSIYLDWQQVKDICKKYQK